MVTDVTMRLNEISVYNENLPPLKNAKVTLTLDNETKTYTIHTLDEVAHFVNIPHKAIGKVVHVSVTCKDWLPIDTTLVLAETLDLNIARDPHPYGDIRFRLWDVNTESTYPNIPVSINGHDTSADAEGIIQYTMPLAEQHTFYVIKAPVALENDTLDMPTKNVIYKQVK